MSQVDSNFSQSGWQDTSLSSEKRLQAFYDKALALVSVSPQKAYLLYHTFKKETFKPITSAYFDSLKLDFLRTLAFNYIYISPDTAIHLSEELLILSKKMNNIKGQLRAYRRLGKAYEQKGKLDSTSKYLIASIKLRQKTKIDTLIGIGYVDYGGLMVSKEEYDSALIYYNRAEQIYKGLNLNSRLLATVYNNKGVVYYYQGDFRNAIDNYFLSLKIDEKLSNYKNIAAAKVNIGQLFDKMGELEKALEYYYESYQYYEGQNQLQTLGAIIVLESLASVKSDQGKYDEAKNLFEEVLIRSKKLGSPYRISNALLNRGVINGRMKKYNIAISDFKEAAIIAERIDNKRDLQIILANLGDTYLDIGLIDEAIDVSKQALELDIIEKSPSLQGAIIAYINLYEANKRRGDYALALEMFEKHIQLRDSLESKENYRKLIEQKYEYQYEKKALKDKLDLEKQRQQKLFLGIFLFAIIIFFFIIQRFRRQKFQIEKRNAVHKAVFNTEDAERARFASDLHDQVGSTLTFALFSLEPLKKFLDSSPNQIRHLNNSISSIQTAMDDVRRISYDLMPKSLETGGLILAVKELLEKIKVAKGPRIRAEFPELMTFMTKTEEVQLYRIIKALVANTLKYANASFITILMEVRDQTLHLTFRDDGIGMNLQDALAYSAQKGQGLIGIQQRCELVEAEFQMTSTPGNGFTFKLSKEVNK